MLTVSVGTLYGLVVYCIYNYPLDKRGAQWDNFVIFVGLICADSLGTYACLILCYSYYLLSMPHYL